MRKNAKKVVSYVLTTALSLATVFSPGSGFGSSTAKAATTPARVSVHDPSVAVSKEGTYYVFGLSHCAAKSTDLSIGKLLPMVMPRQTTSCTGTFPRI